MSYSIGTLLIENNIKPLLVAGLGIGEYSALASIKGLTLPDGLYFLTKQAQIYQEFLTEHNIKLFEVKSSDWQKIHNSILDKKLKKSVHLSTVFSDKVIVACKQEARELCTKIFEEHSLSTREVPLGLGLHTPFAEPVLNSIKDYVLKIDFKDTEVPLLTACDGLPKKNGQEIKDALLSSIDTPIRWDIISHKLEHMDLIIEIGPGTTLSKQLSALYPHITLCSINKPTDIAQVCRYLNKPMIENDKPL